MVVKLNQTWYPYCEIDAATVQRLIAAESAGHVLQSRLSAADQTARMARFDCRDHPMPDYPR